MFLSNWDGHVGGELLSETSMLFPSPPAADSLRQRVLNRQHFTGRHVAATPHRVLCSLARAFELSITPNSLLNNPGGRALLPVFQLEIRRARVPALHFQQAANQGRIGRLRVACDEVGALASNLLRGNRTVSSDR